MKRKLLATALVLCMATGLMSGCGSKESGSTGGSGSTAAPAAQTGEAASGGSESAQAESQDPVTLRWAMWDLDGTVYYKPLVEAYKAKNPHVEIEFVDLGSADYSVMLSTQLAGGSDLDILAQKEVPAYGNLIKQGHLEPLGTYMAENDIKKEDYNGLIEQISYDDEVYALPFRNDIWMTFYNKDLFDKAGVAYPTNDMTFDEYQELAVKMTSGEGNDKVYGNHYHTWWSTVEHFPCQGDGKSAIATDYSFMKPYYESVLQAQKDGTCMEYALLKTSGTHYSGVFYNQQTAMVHMGSWFITMQMDKVKSGESLATNWGMVKLPHIDGVEAGTGPSTITSLSVNANSQNKAAAFDFIKFVAGSKGAEILAGLGTFPAYTNDDIFNTIAALDGFPQDEASKGALKPGKTKLEMPMNENGAEILQIINEGHDDIMTGNLSIDEGLEKMGTRVKAIIGE